MWLLFFRKSSAGDLLEGGRHAAGRCEGPTPDTPSPERHKTNPVKGVTAHDLSVHTTVDDCTQPQWDQSVTGTFPARPKPHCLCARSLEREFMGFLGERFVFSCRY